MLRYSLFSVDTTDDTILSFFLSYIVGNVTQFYEQHSNRQGIAVLGFQANSVEAIKERYRKLHPKLVCGEIQTYENAKLFEVYAYYKGDSSDSDADTGTVLRFVESLNENDSGGCLLPGLVAVEAQFDEDSQAAYCDHWVSNGTCGVGLFSFTCTMSFISFIYSQFTAGQAFSRHSKTRWDSTQRYDRVLVAVISSHVPKKRVSLILCLYYTG